MELKLNPVTGVIIICERCDIVVLWRASLNAYYHYYYYNVLMYNDRSVINSTTITRTVNSVCTAV